VVLAALTLVPWLLSEHRRREEAAVNQVHRQQAEHVVRVSEQARSLLEMQRRNQQRDGQIVQISDLYQLTKETARALRLEDLFTGCLAVAPRLLDARGLRLIDTSTQPSRVLRAVRAADGRLEPSDSGALLPAEAAVLDEVAASRAPGWAAADRLGAGAAAVRRLAWAPLRHEQQPIGVLIADDLPEPHLETLGVMGQQLSLQLARIRLYAQVEALAVTDTLTGLFVRGHFLERAKEELDRSARHAMPCTLIMTDLDLFKQKNDTYGHLVGDVILRDIARLLQRNLRDIDLIARYGGEECVLLLVETGSEQAMLIAERLRQLVEIHPVRAYDELVHQTISMGLATFPEHGKTVDALIERADQALYAAKRAGRNRVVLWKGAA
jgi:diguanylate cyclase (GGDEF)-like protein